MQATRAAQYEDVSGCQARRMRCEGGGQGLSAHGGAGGRLRGALRAGLALAACSQRRQARAARMKLGAET